MKKLFYMAVAAIAALSSCSQDEVFQNEVSEPKDGVFTATIENPSTRTTLGEKNLTNNTYPVLWQVWDEISINGQAYTADNDGVSTSTFAPSGAEATGTTYTAYYPSNLALDFSVPSTQIYRKGQNHSLPMKAISTDKNLTFKNVCGVLAITIYKKEGSKTAAENLTQVQSITISSNKAMSGTLDESTFQLKDDTKAYNTTTLHCSETVTLTEEGTTFYVAVPANTYQDLKIDVFDGIYKHSMTTKSGKDIQIQSSYYYPITFESQSDDIEYFTLNAVDGDVLFKFFTNVNTKEDVQLEYKSSTDTKWSDINVNNLDEEYKIKKGTSMAFRAKSTSGITSFAKFDDDAFHYSCFKVLSGQITASGNIMTLLSHTTPASELTSTNDYAFTELFYECDDLLSASDLKLPATKLSKACYQALFWKCHNLTEAPFLPVAQKTNYCYKEMFKFCYNLKAVHIMINVTSGNACFLNWLDEAGTHVDHPLIFINSPYKTVADITTTQADYTIVYE